MDDWYEACDAEEVCDSLTCDYVCNESSHKMEDGVRSEKDDYEESSERSGRSKKITISMADHSTGTSTQERASLRSWRK